MLIYIMLHFFIFMYGEILSKNKNIKISLNITKFVKIFFQEIFINQ